MQGTPQNIWICGACHADNSTDDGNCQWCHEVDNIDHDTDMRNPDVTRHRVWCTCGEHTGYAYTEQGALDAHIAHRSEMIGMGPHGGTHVSTLHGDAQVRS